MLSAAALVLVIVIESHCCRFRCVGTDYEYAYEHVFHNLVRLADMSGQNFTAEERVLLERLSLYYLQARYPPEIAALAKSVKRAMAADHLQQTEALWKRLMRQLRRAR